MRINYGQNVSISGLAGGVSLCGSGGDLWSVKGGNWQLADGLIRYTNASLYMNHKVVSVTSIGGRYEVGIESGGVMACDAVVLATSLDESKIVFTPPINIPKRFMQHTYTTFVRGLLNVVCSLILLRESGFAILRYSRYLHFILFPSFSQTCPHNDGNKCVRSVGTVCQSHLSSLSLFVWKWARSFKMFVVLELEPLVSSHLICENCRQSQYAFQSMEFHTGAESSLCLVVPLLSGWKLPAVLKVDLVSTL